MGETVEKQGFGAYFDGFGNSLKGAMGKSVEFTKRHGKVIVGTGALIGAVALLSLSTFDKTQIDNMATQKLNNIPSATKSVEQLDIKSQKLHKILELRRETAKNNAKHMRESHAELEAGRTITFLDTNTRISPDEQPTWHRLQMAQAPLEQVKTAMEDRLLDLRVGRDSTNSTDGVAGFNGSAERGRSLFKKEFKLISETLGVERMDMIMQATK